PVVPPAADVDALAARLNAAPSVTILAGVGAAGARDELFALAGKLKAPIVHTLRGKEALERDNPFDVGMTGLLGFASGYRAMEAADTVLLLGTDFPYRQFYPSRAHLLQVDLRGEQIGRRAPVELAVVGDVRSTLQALLPRVPVRPDSSHLERSLADYRKARTGLDERAADPRPGGKIHPQYVVRVLDELAGPDAIFSCDVGTPTVWAARYLHLTGRRRL
ncbi:thiamine pyrophosphate protein TPP binding domain protein, partial [mine drainage metagenome]